MPGVSNTGFDMRSPLPACLPWWLSFACLLLVRPAACRAPAQTAVLVKRLRQALEALLGRKVRQPGLRLEEAGGSLIQSIVDLLNHEEAAQRWDR